MLISNKVTGNRSEIPFITLKMVITALGKWYSRPTGRTGHKYGGHGKRRKAQKIVSNEFHKLETGPLVCQIGD
jgi:hypothetical protein